MKASFLHIVGDVSLKSNLTLEEVGEILSRKVFGGLPFEGREKHIHEEIPAIYIASPIIGLRIVLDGYSGFDEDAGFTVEIMPWIRAKDAPSETVNLDGYLAQILKIQLEGVKDIIVLE